MRFRIAAAAVATALVVILALWWPRSTHTPTASRPSVSNTAAAPPAPSASTQAELEAAIIREGLTPERARQLFSIVVGPLPGVTVTTTPSTNPADFDGTPAVLDIYRDWSSLTPEQQRAATALISKPGRASTYAEAARPRMIAAAFHFDADPQPRYDYGQLLVDADLTLEKLLGVPHVRIVWQTDFDPPTGSEYAHTDSWMTQNGQVVQASDHACHIAVHDQKFSGLTPDDAKAVMTHEMFHCYQQRAAGDYDSMIAVRDWIKEGEPTWVMAAVVPTATVFAKDWTAYANSPATRFHQRGQDGIGVFGHMSDRAGDNSVWSKLLLLVHDAVQDKYGFAAFDDLINGWEADYYTSWGSSYFLSKEKPAWTMTGPAAPPTSDVAPTKQFIPVDTPQALQMSGPFESQLLELTTDADILDVKLLTGYGRVHDHGFTFDAALNPSGVLALCLKTGGCRCPDGSPGASAITERATAPISVGLNGGRATAQIGVAGLSMTSFCKDPDPKPGPEPPAPGGGGGDSGGADPPAPEKPAPGSSSGDTHLLTFDGVKYDLQAVGEYTLVRSTNDDFLIQTRQVPVLQSKTVTVNQAVATKVGSQRVTVSIENNTAVLRVDGRIIGDAAPRLAAGSLTIAKTMYGTTFTLEWPDGTTASVEQLGPRALNVRVSPAKTRMGTLAGLLGDGDGSPANDLVGVGGTNLGVQPSPDDITHSLADAWRVTPPTSLFDYRPGQSTTTFVDPTFPDSHVDASRVPNRDTAEHHCRDAGIIDARLLDNCIVDYGVTSDFLFASTYSHEQQVLAARARIAPAAAGVLRTVTFDGRVAQPGDHPSMQFDAAIGDLVWIGNPDCTDNYMRAVIVDPNGQTVASDALCAIGRHALPMTGRYTLRTANSNNPVGAYHAPIRFVRPDHARPVKNNDIVTGRIESRGIHDLYTFDGHAGDVVRVSGAGCDIGSLTLGFLLPNGADVLGPSCRAGSDSRLTMDGPYRLVVNAADGATGTYRFVFQTMSTHPPK